MAHIRFALGFAIADITFAGSKQGGSYRDTPAPGITAHYHDVWGG